MYGHGPAIMAVIDAWKLEFAAELQALEASDNTDKRN